MVDDNRNDSDPVSDRQRTLRQLEQLSRWLDATFHLPGTRFKIGWDAIIGLIPGVGDVATVVIASWIVLQAKRMGASRWTLLRMLGHIGFDALLGLVPLLGDVFDAAYKSNQKNVELLRRELAKHGSVTLHDKHGDFISEVPRGGPQR